MQEEEVLQIYCYDWFQRTYPELIGLLIHVPNGGKRNAREASKLKRMGVFPGVADFLFFYKSKTHFIELKTQTGTQSKNQKFFETKIVSQGFSYYIVRSYEAFKILISNIVQDENFFD